MTGTAQLKLFPWKTFSYSDQGPMMPKMPQMDLIAELKKRQVKPQVTDGAIEGIITGKNVLHTYKLYIYTF